MQTRVPWSAIACALLAACSEAAECGPSSGVVSRVIDGDTVELSSGERIRYLMLDTPEDTNGHVECYGPEAHEFNQRLVEGQRVSLRYDTECRDRYGRALAYVSVGSLEVNTALVAEGFACVLHIPPNGDARAREFEALEAGARVARRGLWGACDRRPCE